MKERIFTGWNFSRAIYLILGIALMIQAAMSHQYFGVAFGAYFASMGLFKFGCASGNCYTGNLTPNNQTKNNSLLQDIEFEEIK